MDRLVRFGVSMDSALLDSFDELIAAKGYANRSEAIRDLVRNRLVEEDWKGGSDPMVATLTFIYDHHVADLQDRLTHLQHEHDGLVLSALHVHLEHHNCIEVLVMKGSAEAIEQLSDGILGSRGVKHGQLVRSTAGTL